MDDQHESGGSPGPDRTPTLRHRLVLAGALFGFTGVALGAFGAHWLSGRLEPDALDTFETAVRYQLFHAVALLALAGIATWSPTMIRWVGRLFVAGILIFAGSLYGLVYSGVGMLGAITPIGGLCFLAGWMSLAWAAWREGSPDSA